MFSGDGCAVDVAKSHFILTYRRELRFSEFSRAVGMFFTRTSGPPTENLPGGVVRNLPNCQALPRLRSVQIRRPVRTRAIVGYKNPAGPALAWADNCRRLSVAGYPSIA